MNSNSPFPKPSYTVLQSELTREPTDLSSPDHVFLRELLHVPLDPEPGGIALIRTTLPPDDATPLRDALLFVHGLAQNHHTWHLPNRSMPNYFAALGYDTYMVDLRGQGISRRTFGAPPAEHPDDYIRRDIPAAVAALLDHTPCEGLFLIGHSLGGATSYACAPLLKTSGALRGVITLAGLFGLAQTNGFLHQLCRLGTMIERLGLPPKASIPLHALSKRALLPSQPLLDHPFASLLPFHGWVPRTTHKHVLRHQLKRGMDQISVGVGLALAEWGIEGHFRARDGSDYVTAFRDAGDIPLFVLAADDDILISPADAYEATRWSGGQDVEYLCFDRSHGGRHWGHLDIVIGDRAPSFVWPAIADWLDRHDDGERYTFPRSRS